MKTIAQIPEEILSKIRKCLALTESNWEGESRNAMEAAQKLMEAYGLTQAEVEMTEDHQHIKAEAFAESAVESSHGFHAWERTLGTVMEHLLPVKSFTRHRSMIFIGAASDSSMASAFYRILFSEVRNLSKSETGGTAQRAFMYGCAKTLQNRAYQIACKRKEEEKNGTSLSHALVVVKGNDVAKYVKQNYHFTNSRSSAPNGAYGDSTERGRTAGQSISLNMNRSLGNVSQRRLS